MDQVESLVGARAFPVQTGIPRLIELFLYLALAKKSRL
jgi:hypothetical protein